MSFTNTYLSNQNHFLNSQRMQNARPTRPFAANQQLHPQNYEMASWLDRNKIINQTGFVGLFKFLMFLIIRLSKTVWCLEFFPY